MKITIIGTGNIGSAIALGLAKGSMFAASDITCTDMSEKALDNVRRADYDFVLSMDNITAVRDADIIILAVKPWKVESVINEIKTAIDYEKQIVVSIAAGVTFEDLASYFVKGCVSYLANCDDIEPAIFRVIPNTAIAVCSSMTFISAYNASDEQSALVLRIFRELGNAMLVEERLMAAGTSLASSGIAFALRYIRAAIEGGVELGFYPQEAQSIVINTVQGAIDLLIENNSNPEAEIDKVTTPGGITIRGLNEMEVSGFTASVIRGLKASR
ncbi:MAG: pyrroline-5-carboxylate reductase [Prevotellaceae bacterium]|jgi:pyrroline-5-carboxylate reductase|nr:pyrroline-5-carboxylate reductase [Prevotellaceae bacterium]